MKALVTGAGGWLGSELTKQLLEKGYEVKALDRVETNSLKSLKKLYNNKLEISLGDICDFKFIGEILKDIDVVYHLAAKVHSIPKNQEEEKIFFKINTEATENLFEKSLESKVKRVIFYSSVAVYGDSEEIITVDSFKNPKTAYGKSKLEAEEIGMKLYKEKNLPLTIIEPVTVYGGEDVGNFEKLKKLIDKGFVLKFGDGNNKKTVIYFEDLVKMTINISEDERSIGKIIIAGTETLTFNEILNILNKSRKAKVISFNDFITKSMINILNFLKLKKFSRQIFVLKSNNNFNVVISNSYLNRRKTFEDYYLGDI